MIVNTIGPPDATIMLVGEAPGEQEDRTGKPFGIIKVWSFPVGLTKGLA